MHIPFLPATLAVTLALAGTAARADTLAGSWSGHADGRPISLNFDGRGGGWFDGRPIRYTTNGSLLTVEDQGETRQFQYQLNAGQLLMGGGHFQTTIVLSRTLAAAPAPQPPRPVAQAPAVPPPVAVAPPVRPPAPAQPAAPGRPPAAAPAAGGTPSELVGRWCQASTYTASTGGSARQSACFDLRADGSYRYEPARTPEAGAGAKDRDEDRERRQGRGKDDGQDRQQARDKDGDKERQQARGKDGDKDRQQARDKDGDKERQARDKDGEKGRGKDGDKDQDREVGRWTATDTTLTADPRKGAPTTYRLERRNHPASRAPMLCLNGDCYVTAAKRQPW